MLSWILCLVVVLSGLSSVFGEGPQVSQWAIEVLNEGETYGIYPQGWYYDGFFKLDYTG
jgi:hypothetical protein